MKILINCFKLFILISIISCSTINMRSYAYNSQDNSQILLKGNINFPMLRYLKYKFPLMKKSPIFKRDITIFLDSNGGYVDSGIAIYNYIKKLTKIYNVHTVVINKCMSACVLLLQAGDVRVMKENTKIMLHKPRFIVKIPITEDGISEEDLKSIEKLKVYLKENQNFNNLCLIKINKKYKQQILDKMKKDWYLNPISAKNHNLIDIIRK